MDLTTLRLGTRASPLALAQANAVADALLATAEGNLTVDVQTFSTKGDQLTTERYIAAVPQFFPAIFYFSNPFKVWSDLRKFKSSFNSGVLLTDLSYWSEETYAMLKHYLALDAQNDHQLYYLGDETVFNIMFKDTYIPLPKNWNCCGYGQLHWVARLLSKKPEDMNVVHWSGGHHKPWESDRVIYSDLWKGYLPASEAC